MTTNWILLFIAGVLEIAWVVGMKYADGFTKLWPSVFVLTTTTASFLLLNLAVRGLPLGTAYAIWTGMGVAGATALGIVLFNEPASALRILFVFMIMAGIVGLKLTPQA